MFFFQKFNSKRKKQKIMSFRTYVYIYTLLFFSPPFFSVFSSMLVFHSSMYSLIVILCTRIISFYYVSFYRENTANKIRKIYKYD